MMIMVVTVPAMTEEECPLEIYIKKYVLKRKKKKWILVLMHISTN